MDWMKYLPIVAAFLACVGANGDDHESNNDHKIKSGIVKPRLVQEDSSQRKCFGDEEAIAYHDELQNAVVEGVLTEHDAIQKMGWMKENLCWEARGKEWSEADDDWMDTRAFGFDECKRVGIIVHDGIPQVIEKDGIIFTFDRESRTYRAIGFRPAVD